MHMTVTVDRADVAAILKAFDTLPTAAADALTEHAEQAAAGLVSLLRAAAAAEGRQAALMAPTIEVDKGRDPSIAAGGNRRVGRNSVPAGVLLYGSEYGGKRPQFRPWQPSGSYWFGRTIDAHEAEVWADWLDSARSILDAFEGRP